MLIRSAIIASFVLTLSMPAYAAGCHVDRFTNALGSETNVNMAAKSGANCSIKFGGVTMRSTPTMGDRTTTISVQAQHGTAQVDGNNHVSYVSARGYAGPDQFVIERSGDSFSNKTGHTMSGTARYDVNVNVSP